MSDNTDRPVFPGSGSIDSVREVDDLRRILRWAFRLGVEYSAEGKFAEHIRMDRARGATPEMIAAATDLPEWVLEAYDDYKESVHDEFEAEHGD